MQQISSREFNQDIGRAKRAADRGPVVITDRGRPAYVLLKHDAYQRLAARAPAISALIAHPASADFEFEAPRLGDQPVNAAEF